MDVQEEPLDLSMKQQQAEIPTKSDEPPQIMVGDLQISAAQLQMQAAFLEFYSMIFNENFFGIFEQQTSAATTLALKNLPDLSKIGQIDGDGKNVELQIPSQHSGRSRRSKKIIKTIPEIEDVGRDGDTEEEDDVKDRNGKCEDLERKRKIQFNVNIKRFEANARERNRVQQLSNMFDSLRLCLPIQNEIKISKLSTLKVASAYIEFLRSLLADENSEIDSCNEKLSEELESAKTLKKT